MGTVTPPPPPNEQASVGQQPAPDNVETAVPAPKGIATAPELSAFKDLNGTHHAAALTYWIIANSPKEFPPEEAMDLLSPEYHNERDPFRKQDIVNTEWPRYQQELAAYKGMEYVYIPLGKPRKTSFDSPDELYSPELYMRDYDFQRKGFPLAEGNFGSGGGTQCLEAYSLRNQNHVTMELHSDVDCFLPMEDEAQARRLSEIWHGNPSNWILGFGRLYLRLSLDPDGQRIHGEVVAAEVEWRTAGRSDEPTPQVQFRTLMKSPQYKH